MGRGDAVRMPPLPPLPPRHWQAGISALPMPAPVATAPMRAALRRKWRRWLGRRHALLWATHGGRRVAGTRRSPEAEPIGSGRGSRARMQARSGCAARAISASGCGYLPRRRRRRRCACAWRGAGRGAPWRAARCGPCCACTVGVSACGTPCSSLRRTRRHICSSGRRWARASILSTSSASLRGGMHTTRSTTAAVLGTGSTHLHLLCACCVLTVC